MHSEHSFSIKLAVEVGVEKAILLKNIHWWVLKNAKNGVNFRKGKFWTYSSSAALGELFPYMSPASIRRWLQELESERWIITGNFNRRGNDNTKWYSLGNSLIEFCKVNGMDLQTEPNIADQNDQQDDEPVLFTDQNEQYPAQNDQPVAQNDQSTDQNDQALPDIDKDIKEDVVEVVSKDDNNYSYFLSRLKDINTENSGNVKSSIAELFEAASIQYSEISGERVRAELKDIRSELTESDIWELMIQSFIEVSGANEAAKNTNYLIAKIRGKKDDLYSARTRQIKSNRLRNGIINRHYAGQECDGEANKGMKLAKEEFESVKDELNKATIKKIEGLIEEEKYLSVLVELMNSENKKQIEIED